MARMATAADTADAAAAQGNLPKVALLGVGLMGNKMARRLRQQGFDVVAWNRTSERAQALADVRVSLTSEALSVCCVLTPAADLRSTICFVSGITAAWPKLPKMQCRARLTCGCAQSQPT